MPSQLFSTSGTFTALVTGVHTFEGVGGGKAGGNGSGSSGGNGG